MNPRHNQGSKPHLNGAAATARRLPSWLIAAPALMLFCGFFAGKLETCLEAQTNLAKPLVDAARTNEAALAAEFQASEEAGFTNELMSEDGTIPTNNPAQIIVRPTDGASSPTEKEAARRTAQRRSDRTRQRTPTSDGASSDTGSSSPGSSRASGQLARPDFATFKIIAERNIFDPNRLARRRGAPTRQKPTVESFSLVGIMSYEKGTFAFFDGTSSSYKKALKYSDTIAGYKLTGISQNAVTLVAGTNQVELKVGAQLRREEDGEWLMATQSETYAANSSSVSSATTRADSAPSGDESEILKRLRQRKEQE